MLGSEFNPRAWILFQPGLKELEVWLGLNFAPLFKLITRLCALVFCLNESLLNKHNLHFKTSTFWGLSPLLHLSFTTWIY